MEIPAPATHPHAAYPAQPVTSDLTNEEMWNLVHMGYLPLKLVLGTAVYSLGVVGGLKAMFSSFTRGEVTELTSLIYDAREHAIGLIRDEASAIGAWLEMLPKPYPHYASVLWELGHHGQALEVLEHGRARGLAMQAARNDADPGRSGI